MAGLPCADPSPGNNIGDRTKLLSGTASKDGARDLLSGMLSGFVCKIVEYPLDTVKVLEQTGGTRFSGPLDCIRKVVASSGFMTLYSGLTAPLLGAAAENAALFVSYGYIKNLLGVDEEAATLRDPVPFYKLLAAAGGSGFASTCVLTPAELVKCRLQAQLIEARPGVTAPPHYRGSIDCVVRTVRADGLAGLYRGNMSTLAREVPGNMAWFGTYEGVMRAVQTVRGDERKRDVPLYWSAFSGSWAGVAYWLVPFPADTVKSKIQADERFRGQPFARVLRTVLQEEGMRGLYKGCAITCARAVPSHALIFYFYELSSSFLKRF